MMVSPEQVTRYRTDDGCVFDSEAEAVRHEARSRLGDILQKVAAYDAISVDSAVEVLFAHAAEVIAILSGELT